MKQFRHIQNLFLFFTLFFLASGVALILAFKNNLYAVAACSLTTLAGVWLMVRALLMLRGYFHAFKQREARLVLLASRDPATGLFERNGFETLLAQEIERAKRRDYSLTLVLIQVEPLAQIQHDIGATATDRLMFQIGEGLQKHCRHYDSAFKIDAGTFALYFAETHVSELAQIIKRLQKRLQNTAFLVNAERLKITPIFKLGAAIYPLDGTSPQTLEAFARTNLSENFEMSSLRHPEKQIHKPQDLLPVESAHVKADPQPDETPLMIASDVSESVVSNPTTPETDFTPDFSHIDTVRLQGTPEMSAFQNELSALFARAETLEKNVKKLITDDLQTAPTQKIAEVVATNTDPTPIRETPKTEADIYDTATTHSQHAPQDGKKPSNPPLNAISTSEAQPAQTIPVIPTVERINPLRPVKSPEALPLIRQPLPGQQYFQKTSPKTTPTPAVSQKKLETPRLNSVSMSSGASSSWSAEELADMPDVVAALMQNEISRL